VQKIESIRVWRTPKLQFKVHSVGQLDASSGGGDRRAGDKRSNEAGHVRALRLSVILNSSLSRKPAGTVKLHGK
jgi:hypothetical protein